jgi:SAGA-associated factor 73
LHRKSKPEFTDLEPGRRLVTNLTAMSLRPATPSTSPDAPFTFNRLSSSDSETRVKNEQSEEDIDVAFLPSPPTSWLSAKDMKIFGAAPLVSSTEIGIVRCRECQKPVLKSAVAEHAGMQVVTY